MPTLSRYPWETAAADTGDWRRIDPEVQRQRDREAALIRSTETDNPELAGIEDRVAEVGGQKRKKYDRVDNPMRAPEQTRTLSKYPWEEQDRPTNKYSKYHLPLSTDIPKERGFFDELGTQLVGGALVDLPEMTGQGLKFLERETGLETGDLGRRMVAGARERAPQYERSGQERGFTADVLLSGARGVAPVLAAAPLAFVPGVGTSAAALAAGTLFGTSSAQETYDKLIAQGVSPEEATAASRRVGLIQGAGETIATAVGAKAFKPLLKGKTTAGLVADLTDTSILNPFAKGMAVNMLVQPTTEVAQDVGASLVERAYGGKAEDLYAIGKESFKGGLGLTLLLGPLSIGGHVSRSNNAATLKAALSDDLSIPPEVKQQAITAVQTAAQQKGIKDEDIADWVTKQIELEDRRNDALRRIEDAINYDVEIGDPKTLAEYDKAFNSPSGEKITEVGADGKKKTRELTIGELIQEQAKRNILGELTEEPTNLLTPSVMNAQDYLQKMRRENILGSTDPLTQVETGKQVAPGVTQTASGTYVTAPEDQVSQGLGRQMPQAAYGVPGVTTTGGGVYQINPEQLQGPAAQVQTGQRVAEPQVMGGLARPAAPVPSSGPAAVSPGVITPPGSFTPPVVAAPTVAAAAAPAKPAAKPKAAKVVAPVVAPAVTVTRGDEIKTTEAAKQEPIDEGLAEEIEAAINKLNATVISEKGKAGGRVSLPQGVFKGLVRMLRSPDEVAPIVYAEKGAAVDVEATKKYGGTVRKIYDAAQRVLHTSRDLASAEANALKEQTTINAKPGAPTVAAAEIKAKATTEKITLLRQQLRNAIEGLVNASGSERNADALISVLKSKTQKRTTKPVNPKRFKEVAAALKKKEDISQAEYDTILDSLISRAWRAYKDNELDTAEFADIVKSEPTRTSTEAGKAKVAQPLVSAAEGKASKPFRAVTVQKKTETAEEFAARQQEALDKYKARLEEGTGVQGLLNFFRGPNQSAYTNALATAITQALRRRGAKQPKLAWIEDGDTTTNPSYNPKTDTVLVHKTASAEETLHETLHAALQWLVHSNPNLVEVQRLAKSLDKVLAVNIDSTSLSNAQKEKAKEVVAVLNKIVNRTKNKSTAKLDAVLELMSYGTTLADFKALLKDIPSTNDAATRSWRTAVTDLWNNIVSLAQSLLGVSNTVANDVLENTISLLNKAATAEVLPTKSTGNILESALNTATAARSIGITS